MAKHEGLVLLTLLSLPMLAIPAQVQASEFATYNNLLFKIYYPSGWTVNQTGTVKQGNVTFVENATRPPQAAAMAVNQTGTVKQGNVTSVENATRPPQAAAMARVLWLPENMSMNSDLSHHNAHGWVTTMINNDSYYLLGQRAVVIDQTDGYNKQLTFATNVNGTTYEVSYVATIDHFLNHISQFNVMVASFNIHGHVPKLKASTSSQESNKTSSSQESNKTSLSQESSKTGNGATSPTSSYQAVKTPYVSKTVKSPYVSKTVRTSYVSKTIQSQESNKITAKLTGSNAILPVNTPATGIAGFELSSNGKVLNYHLSTTNLKGFKDASICEKQQNINYTTNKTYETCEGVAGSLSMGKGKITSDDLYGRFEDAPLSDLIKSMRSGELYVAIDTQQHHWYPPGTGEIFGQIRSGG